MWLDALYYIISPFDVTLSNCSLRTRAAIRDYHPNYAVTAHMWPSFLYAKGQYDPENPSNGLFKGELLVRVCSMHFDSRL